MKIPLNENRSIPKVPAKIPSAKKTCESENGITELRLKSMQTEIKIPGRPPIMLEIKRAEVIARERSAGLGEIAADIPQNGMSPIV